jgi:Ulp1 family protease
MIIDDITTGIIEATNSPYNYYLIMINLYNYNHTLGGPPDYLNISLFLSRKYMRRRIRGENLRGYTTYHYKQYFFDYNAPDRNQMKITRFRNVRNTFFSNEEFEQTYQLYQSIPNERYFSFGESGDEWKRINEEEEDKYNGIERQKVVDADKHKLCYFGVYLEMKDLKLFFGQSWFNDTIIDTFFRCISFHSYHFSEVKMEQKYPNEAITILSVSTRFWDKLLYLNGTGSRHSTAKYNYNNGYNYLLQNIFDFKIIYLPANINNNHWILIVIDVEKRKIFGFDSSNKHETNSNNMVHKYCGYIKQFILDDLIRKTDYTNIQKETTNEY